ncbi:MBL fold metallo-hydrolase [Paraburkholderia sp. SOS3]|uniref:MBL fold metallo-hydrolase n=1 Tax=Paraburkholderia sp. SOS3 TaxID=1926494 RepID=UPI0009477914|nr:MBL fold metallo-hydrolase [Paraburkholderia sp. SOS3]APR35210.1 hypothetical protein BTO02_06960 [Paraburkholderia sp. SOS3]
MEGSTDLDEQHSTRLEEFYSSKSDGVFYLSHASILVRLNQRTFLFDPVLAKPPHLGSWLFYPEMQMDKRLLEVDAVFVSHQHQDHYDVDFLRMLPPHTPVYIVSGRPQFAEMLGKERIAYTELVADRVTELFDGVSCLGINHEYNGIDAAIAISNGKFTVYHGNDCFVSNEKLEIIKRIYPKIDVACIPFAYVHWYPFLLDGVDEAWKKKETDRLVCEYLEYGLRQIEFLRPEVAIPFGANMFYADDVDSEHNKAVMSPFDFKEYAEKKDFAFKDNILPLFSGDTVLFEEAGERRRLDVHWNRMTRDDLMRGFDAYLSRVRVEGTGFDAQAFEALTYDQIKDIGFIADRLKDTGDRMGHKIYISNSDNPAWGVVEVDISSHAVERKSEIDETLPYHHFKLTDLAYKAYFSQQYTFNEIVASSRFKLSRKPNEYHLEVLRIVNNVL